MRLLLTACLLRQPLLYMNCSKDGPFLALVCIAGVLLLGCERLEALESTDLARESTDEVRDDSRLRQIRTS